MPWGPPTQSGHGLPGKGVCSATSAQEANWRIPTAPFSKEQTLLFKENSGF